MSVLSANSLAFNCLLVLVLFALCTESNVVYRRFQKPHQSDSKVKIIREIFKTARRPPSFSLSDADIDRFLKGDTNCKRPTRRPSVPKKLITTKAPFIINSNEFGNVNPDYTILLPSVATPTTTFKPSISSTSSTSTTTSSTTEKPTDTTTPFYPDFPTTASTTTTTTTVEPILSTTPEEDIFDENEMFDYNEDSYEEDYSSTTDDQEVLLDESLLHETIRN